MECFRFLIVTVCCGVCFTPPKLTAVTEGGAQTTLDARVAAFEEAVHEFDEALSSEPQGIPSLASARRLRAQLQSKLEGLLAGQVPSFGFAGIDPYRRSIVKLSKDSPGQAQALIESRKRAYGAVLRCYRLYHSITGADKDLMIGRLCYEHELGLLRELGQVHASIELHRDACSEVCFHICGISREDYTVTGVIDQGLEGPWNIPGNGRSGALMMHVIQ